MNGLQTAVCVLLCIWIGIQALNALIQLSIIWKQYKHVIELEKSIKNFDNVMDESFKDIKRDKFFQDIEELQKEKFENKEDKGDRE